jgi:hypothetical protein
MDWDGLFVIVLYTVILIKVSDVLSDDMDQIE